METDIEKASILSELAAFEEASETNILVRIDDLAREVAEAELDTAQAQGELDRAKEREEGLRRRLIAACGEARQNHLRVTSGFVVDVKEKWKGSISAARAKRAFKWLRDHGHGALINSQVVVTFKSGEDAQKKQLEKLLQEAKLGAKVAVKEAVHFKRLEGLIAELAREGKLGEEPSEVLGAFSVKQATVKKES